ncbi:MAG: PH domain-containing protein [Cyclobacteriaceae bacterium]
MKRFYSKVDGWSSAIIWGTIIIAWGISLPLLFKESSVGMWIMVTVLIPTTILLGSIFFNTYYIIDSGYLKWYTGPFRGKVRLEEIREIRRCKSSMEIAALMKPSLTFKPLLIKYKKYEDLPVSPAEEIEFIDSLRKVNPHIEVYD